MYIYLTLKDIPFLLTSLLCSGSVAGGLLSLSTLTSTSTIRLTLSFRLCPKEYRRASRLGGAALVDGGQVFNILKETVTAVRIDLKLSQFSQMVRHECTRLRNGI